MENTNVTNKKILTSMSWSFAEKFLTDIVSTVVTIVLSRILLPEDYGVVTLVQIFIDISLIFVCNGFSSALIQNKDADEEQVSTIFYINLILGLVVYAILFILSPFIAELKGNSILCPLFRVLAIKIPISSVYSMQHAYVKKKLDFKIYFFSSLAGTIISGIVGIMLAIKGFGAWALIASTLTDQIMDSVILFITTKWFPKFRINIAKSKKTIMFGTKIFVREFIFRTYNKLSSLIIGFKYKTEDLAFSGKGQKLPDMISTLTESTLVRVLFPVLSNIQDDRVKTKELVRATTQISMLILSPLMFGMAATAYRSIPLILTEKWLPCIPYLQICCANNLLVQISHTDLRAIEANGNGNDLIKMQTVNTCSGLLIILLSVLLFNDPLYIVVGYFISNILSTATAIHYSKKVTNYGIGEHINDIKLPILTSLIMSVAVFFIGKLPLSNLYVLCLQVIFGGIIYIVLNKLFGNKYIELLFDYLKKTIKKDI